MTEVWTGFEALTAHECRRLLRSLDEGRRVGRLAVTVGALPVVVPVQFRLDGDRLLVRTPGHQEVPPAVDGQIVGFEADDLDLATGVGWCVSVTGTARVIDDAGQLEPLHRWFSDGAVLELSPAVVAGHRVVV